MTELELSEAAQAGHHAARQTDRHAARSHHRGGWEGAAAPAPPGAAAAPGSAPRPPVDELADKLDSMMELTLEHLGQRCAAGQLPQAWTDPPRHRLPAPDHRTGIV
jgi:RNA polymerase I-specific transcription initiation factor RRN3